MRDIFEKYKNLLSPTESVVNPVNQLNAVRQGVRSFVDNNKFLNSPTPNRKDDPNLTVKQVTRNTISNAPKQFSELFKPIPYAGNFISRTMETLGTGVTDVGKAGYKLLSDPNISMGESIKAGAEGLYGAGKIVSVGTPLFQGASALTSLGKETPLARFSGGILEGMTGIEDLIDDDVAGKYSNINLLGNETSFDPYQTAGNMVGFVNNPINKNVFSFTDKFNLISKAATPKARLANFMLTNSARGATEDILMSLKDIPDNATAKEKINFLVQNGLWGAASEVSVRGFGKGANAVQNTKLGTQLFDMLKDALKKTPPKEIKELVNLFQGDQPRTSLGRYGEKPKKYLSDITSPIREIRLNKGDDTASLKIDKRFGTKDFTPSGTVRELTQASAGAGFGIEFEYDDEGNIIGHKYNPEKGLIGVAGLVGGRKALDFANQRQFSSLIDKLPRFEIDDSGAKIKPIDAKTITSKLGDVLDHPELFKNYPQLKDVRISVQKGTSKGTYIPDMNMIRIPARVRDITKSDQLEKQLVKEARQLQKQGKLTPEWEAEALKRLDAVKGKVVNTIKEYDKETLLHEIQHAIQQKEGFAKGGVPDINYTDPRQIAELDELIATKIRGINNAKNPEIKSILQTGLESLRKQKKQLESEPFGQYKRLSGELEARAVQRRMDLPANKRAGIDPYAEEAIATTGKADPNEFINKFDTDTAMSIDRTKLTGKQLDTPTAKLVDPKTGIVTANRDKKVTLLKKAEQNYGEARETARQRAEVNKELRSMFSDETLNKIADLKRVIGRNRYASGDIETLRKSIFGKKVNDVIEAVQEVRGDFSAEEALDYAINLPNKADTKASTPVDLKEQLKTAKEALNLDTSKGVSVVPTQKTLNKIEQSRQKAVEKEFNDWKKAMWKQEGVTTPKQSTKIRVDEITNTIRKATSAGGTNPGKMRDLSGFQSYTRDVYRNFKEVYGNDFDGIKRVLLDPFDKSKGDLTKSYKNWASRITKEVEQDLGIKKGTKESAAVQLFGEGKISETQLKSRFGANKAANIVKANQWFRKEYDQLLDEVNATMKSIYPNNPEKIIPKRKDYYRHFKEMSEGIGGLLNIFDSPANIASSLSGTSEYTRPKSKWLSFAQRRLGDESDIDAVGGFLDYVKAAEYNKHIDPHTSKFRALAEDLATQTEENPTLNNFIEYLHDFSNDLAGKTNPADRFIQKVIPGGRKTMRAINWLNNRVKANVILGNASSSVAQIFNVPQGMADAGAEASVRGLGRSIAGIFDDNAALQKSDFITERYGTGAFDQFDRGMVANTKKMAAWMTGVFDEVGTKYIWNAEYEKGLKEGVENPIKFADDATRKMVAGRGIGEVPLIQKSKVFQLVAPFQLEVGNLWHVMGDWVGEKKFGKLAAFFALSYVFNKAAEQVRGSDVSFDPIQASIEAYEAFKEEENKTIGATRAGGRLAGEVISNVPLGQTVASAYPEYGFKVGDTQMPTRSDFFGDGDPTRFGSGLLAVKGLQDPLFKVIPPFGGQQAKRTIEGVKASVKGYSETDSGKVRFLTENNPFRNLQRAIFGQYSTPNARAYFDKGTSPLGENQSENLKQLSGSNRNNYYDSVIAKRVSNKELNSMKEKVKSTGQSKTTSDNHIYVDNESGEVRLIPLNRDIKVPKLTGNSTVDKELLSDYYSVLGKKKNDIIELVKQGVMNPNTAAEQLESLDNLRSAVKQAQKSGTGKGTKKVKKIPASLLKPLPKPRITQVKSRSVNINTPDLNFNVPAFDSAKIASLGNFNPQIDMGGFNQSRVRA